jgi:lysozyme
MTQFYYSEPDKLTLSKDGKAYIMGIEGATPTPYLCPANVWTIGFGVTSTDGIKVKDLPRDRELTMQEMVDQFLKKIKKYEDDVNSAVKVPITQQQFDALVSFHYNTGAIKTATLTKLINSGAPKEDIIASLKKWNKGGGKVLKGLVRRRNEEANMFLNGVYAGSGLVTLVKADKNGKQLWSTAKTIFIMPYL